MIDGNEKWLELNDGIKVNINWLYPKETRKQITIEDWDEDECQDLSQEEQKHFFSK